MTHNHTSATIRTRVAPSPTGHPHIGTVFQALINYLIAKQNHGSFILRIEDTDQHRLVPGAEQAILDALAWVGISPDEGPTLGGQYGPYRQSERLELYHQHVDQLIKSGHAYYCFCSPERLDQVRKDLQSQGKLPMYDRHCRQLNPASAKTRAQSEPHVVRMKVPDHETLSFTDEIRGEISFNTDNVDDQIILKSDGFPTYHLAVVVDDHLMGITHIVRGEEWISSTPKHVLLYRYFNWPMPKLIHTPLLRNPDKSKLAKRHGHAQVAWYQEHGYLPEAVINFLATRVWNHPKGIEIFSLQELIDTFNVKHMHIQGPIVDLSKLNWINGQHIRALTNEQLITKLKPYLKIKHTDPKLTQILPLVKERLETLDQINDLIDFFVTPINPDPKLLLKKSEPTKVADQLNLTLAKLTNLDSWNTQSLESTIRTLQEKHHWPKSQYFMMLRVAVTAKTATPPLFETMEVLTQTNTVDRLTQALQLIKP